MADVTPLWVAVDWGTTNLRAWAVGADGTVLAEAASERGMGTLRPDEFEAALREAVAPWHHGRLRVLACGMVGARQGWVEAPYVAVPCVPGAGGGVRAPAAPDLDVTVLPGLRQDDPPDVMRGEETKVAGALALDPAFDGVLLLPGTHPKWVRVAAGEVVAFRTSLTGEAFAALSRHTVLRHSISEEDGWDEAAFAEGVADGMARPEALMARLFSIRAEGLLKGLTPAQARARLSGLLIGADLAGSKGWWLGARVGLLGAGSLARTYGAALRLQGVAAEAMDATAATLAGLKDAWRRQ